MRVEEFDYHLPPERIAQAPVPRRDESRLMIVDRARGTTAECGFAGIREHLRRGDLLVVNDTKVLPARLRARKATGGSVEILLVRPAGGDPARASWSCMISSGRGLRPGSRLTIAADFEAEVEEWEQGGRLRVRLHAPDGDVAGAIHRHGVPPVPPYIRRGPGDPREGMDRERYQTVYARDEGAIAAPTAGLHFTRELLQALDRSGVGTSRITLHVGPGTFRPVRTARVEEHVVEAEWARLPEETAAAVDACRARGGRVVAVGTTTTRVLEWWAEEGRRVRPGEGMCDLTILPGHRFRVVDALLTNFHLPRSSLLMLVSAFAGRERVLRAYSRAVESGFRFYSYGDAMLLT